MARSRLMGLLVICVSLFLGVARAAGAANFSWTNLPPGLVVVGSHPDVGLMSVLGSCGPSAGKSGAFTFQIQPIKLEFFPEVNAADISKLSVRSGKAYPVRFSGNLVGLATQNTKASFTPFVRQGYLFRSPFNEWVCHAGPSN